MSPARRVKCLARPLRPPYFCGGAGVVAAYGTTAASNSVRGGASRPYVCPHEWRAGAQSKFENRPAATPPGLNEGEKTSNFLRNRLCPRVVAGRVLKK